MTLQHSQDRPLPAVPSVGLVSFTYVDHTTQP
jgi:hypothetical protein